MFERNDDNFGAIAASIGYQLHRLDLLLMADVRQVLSGLGLTPARASALVYIGLHEACDQTALGNALGINRASAMKTVDQLVALDLVERQPGRDRRTHAIHLTMSGKKASVAVTAMTTEQDADFFSVLDADERVELDRLIRKTRDLNRARNESALQCSSRSDDSLSRNHQ